MTLSVVIVTVGAKDYIRLCLDSLLKQSFSPDEVIVIDNSIQPEPVQELKRLYPEVKFYPSSENLFYATGLNKGIDLSRGDFILCLNDDVVLDKDFIRRALEGFSAGSNIGSVSGKILRSDKKTLDSTGLFLSLWRTAKERGYGQPDSSRFSREGMVFGVNGAVAFFRRKMLEEIKDANGYFDSRFGMFYEDLDVAWRAARRGWRAYYLPFALAYHVRGGSFRPDSGIGRPIARKYLNSRLHGDLIKNRYFTIAKNETFLGLLIHFVPILIYDFFAWGYILIFCPKVIKQFFNRLRDARNKAR